MNVLIDAYNNNILFCNLNCRIRTFLPFKREAYVLLDHLLLVDEDLLERILNLYDIDVDEFLALSNLGETMAFFQNRRIR